MKKTLFLSIAMFLIVVVVGGLTGCGMVEKNQKQDDVKATEKTETNIIEDTKETTPSVTSGAPEEVSDLTKEVDDLFKDVSKDSLDDVTADEFSE